VISIAQNKNNKTIKPVTTHTVGPKESISSIGRLYEVNGRVLANYNNIDYDKGLTVGQVLKIPPKGTTLDQVAAPVKEDVSKVKPPVAETEPVRRVVTKTEEGKTPVYHKVGKKETLYHISTLYGKVPVADLKKWNHLTSDTLIEGSNLIVGYSGTKAETVTTPVEKTEKEKEVVVQADKKETPKPVKETETVETRTTNKDYKGGVFKTLFETQNSNGERVNQEGTAGIFKSTSGWTDGKYYCLYNTATPGTIIKITNTSNGKFVFAKVLDAMPDIKQNNGLVICVSNAAAKELGAGDSNFNCSVNYSK
jgi:LysM repeat protein